MNNMHRICLVLVVVGVCLVCVQETVFAQDVVQDPDSLTIIPDKVFEVVVPLVALFILLNTVVLVLKNRAEHQLKTKAIESGMSEQALEKLFGTSQRIASLQPLKWFLITLSSGISLVLLHFLRPYLVESSGYLAVGVVLLMIAIVFFIYHTIMKKKLGE